MPSDIYKYQAITLKNQTRLGIIMSFLRQTSLVPHSTESEVQQAHHSKSQPSGPKL